MKVSSGFGAIVVAAAIIAPACEDSKSCVAPQVVSVSATSGAQGEVVVVTGCGLGALACLSYVAWNGVPGEVRAWKETRIDVAVPRGAGTGAKTIAIVVAGKVLATSVFDVTAEAAQVDAGLAASCDAGVAAVDAGTPDAGLDGGADGGGDAGSTDAGPDGG
ncbi:MAG: hypothetical protein HYY84_18670 [Deltaproteobacteria bacterium]|nr:hypothetical protein [Deltaproteobacteria bacterium]